MDNNFLTTNEVISWIKKWAKNNPSLSETTLISFAKDLNEIMKKLNYKVGEDCAVIGYAGKIGSDGFKTGIFNTVENITKNSNSKYCFINFWQKTILFKFH